MKIALLAALAAPCLAPLAAAQCVQPQWYASDASAADHFGFAIAARDDLAMVGAPNATGVVFGNSGAVYVFERSAGGWVETQKIFGSNGGGGDEFGAALDFDASRAAIGAFRFDDPHGPGAVYVFEKTVGGWVETQILQAASPTGSIGGAVAIDGDRIAAASAFTERVWIFEFDGLMWNEVAELDGVFGKSLDLEGDRLVVGDFQDSNSLELSGACHVYERQLDGTWVLTQTLFASAPVIPLMNFGWDVSLDGDRLAVGAPGREAVSQGAGSVFIFELVGGAWIETAIVEPFDNPNEARVGQSVDLSGDSLLLGSSNGVGSAGGLTGAAMRFELSGSIWEQVARLDAYDGTVMQNLGFSVAFAGETMLVGSMRDEDMGFGTGAVYAFDLSPDVSTFCHCDAGAPCSNEDPWGGCAGANGIGAVLEAFGSASVASDDLVLTTTGLALNQPGIVFMGQNTSAPMPFGDGRRCVAGPVFRFPVHMPDGFGCTQLGPDLVAFTLAEFGPGGQISAGSTWNFQTWNRDPAGPCGSGFNTSNAVRVDFQL